MRFFTTLHSALRNSSRAVFQFYPTSDDQVQLITSIAQKAGFGGGIVVDYPNSKKARKVFLCLFVGGGGEAQVPKGLDGEAVEDAEDRVKFEKRRQRETRREKSGKTKVKGGKDWILKKKEVGNLLLGLDYAYIFIALPEKRKRGRPPRLKIYRSQTADNFLKAILFLCHQNIILYFYFLARDVQETRRV